MYYISRSLLPSLVFVSLILYPFSNSLYSYTSMVFMLLKVQWSRKKHVICGPNSSVLSGSDYIYLYNWILPFNKCPTQICAHTSLCLCSPILVVAFDIFFRKISLPVDLMHATDFDVCVHWLVYATELLHSAIRPSQPSSFQTDQWIQPS